MLSIYTDRFFRQPIDTCILWEGETYYLNLSSYSETDRQFLIARARLENFANFDCRNPICSFAIHGYLGAITLGGYQFDVRSKKLNIHETGEAQFATLLHEIDHILLGLTFRYDSPSTRNGAEEHTAHGASALERLDFYRSRMHHPNAGSSIKGIVQRIISNPHHSVKRVRSEQRVELAKRLDVPAFAKSFGRGDLVSYQSGRQAANGRLAASNKAGETFLPRYVPVTSASITYDTAENRFVRFFLEDIAAVCLEVLRQSNISSIAAEDAKQVLHDARELLGAAFFKNVGKLQNLPSHSPVLMSHEAYSSIYDLHLRSRRSVVDPLLSARQQLRTSPLKDVATLYEIWVFFKIANALFGPGNVVTVSGNNNGGLPFGTTWSAKDWSVSYNRTYAARRGSYSVTLRPDVTVQVGGKIWLFDAKYKSDRTIVSDDDQQSQVSAAVKKIDLHKMHTYVDAISGVVAAVAAYPGTDLSLFPRMNSSGNLLEDLFELGGVGGIPLLPQGDSGVLDDVIAAITGHH